MEKDFTICVLSQRFRTNRQCLQNASDFFAIMFASTCWRESSQDHVELHDIDPETVQEVSVKKLTTTHKYVRFSFYR